MKLFQNFAKALARVSRGVTVDAFEHAHSQYSMDACLLPYDVFTLHTQSIYYSFVNMHVWVHI